MGKAVAHAQTLDVEVKAYSERAHTEPLASLRIEYNSKRHGFVLSINKILIPIPQRWGLMLGDIANNYRCALDHLAWALVPRGEKPPGTLSGNQRRKIGFPIKDLRSEFNGELRAGTLLPGVRRADVAKVRSRQPYLRGTKGSRHHAFRVLADINVGDKHRTIQPVWDAPRTPTTKSRTKGTACSRPSRGTPKGNLSR